MGSGQAELYGQTVPEPVAWTGFPSSTGASYISGRIAVMDSLGRITFLAIIDDVGDGVEQWTTEGLAKIAARGDAAPGTGDGPYFDPVGGVAFPDFFPSEAGVAFAGGLDGDGVNSGNDTGLWFGTSQSVELVAREGDPAAGTEPTTTFDELSIQFSHPRPFVNNMGTVVFSASLQGPDIPAGEERGLWKWDNGVQSLMVRSGDVAPGPTTTFVGFLEPLICDAGDVVFVADLDGTLPYEGLWRIVDGVVSPIALIGNVIPGMKPFTFDSISERPLLSRDGVIVFAADIEGPDVTNANNRTVWAVEDGVYRLVAREGDPAPGTPDGVFFGPIEAATVSGDGFVVVIGPISGDVTAGDNSGLWAETASGLELVIREGSGNGGDLAGFGVSELSPLSNDVTVSMNSGRDIVMQARVTPPDFSTGLGVIAWSSELELTAVALPNQMLSDPNGDDHLVVNAFLASTPAGVTLQDSRGLTDSGDFAFGANFLAGESGVYRAQLPVLGDLNGDGVVNATDLAMLLGAWGPVGPLPEADLNGDGDVNAADLAILLGAWTM